jgi:hypothetical protein
MNNARTYKPGDARKLDAVAEAWAPSVHAALDQEPSEGLLNAVHAAATRHVVRRAHVIVYVWRSVVSLAAALVLTVGAWSIQRNRQSERLQLLDHLLALTATQEEMSDEPETGAESLAHRLLLLQGFDTEVTAQEAEEPAALPATDAQSHSTRALQQRICG